MRIRESYRVRRAPFWKKHRAAGRMHPAPFQQEGLLDAVARVRADIEPNALIYARMHHLAFEAGREIRMKPDVDSLAELREALRGSIPRD
jgi:hypothetical protein